MLTELSERLAQIGIDPTTAETLIRVSIYLTVASVIAAIPTGMIAKHKGRSVAGWVLLALCVPVVPLLLVWLLPDLKPPAG